MEKSVHIHKFENINPETIDKLIDEFQIKFECEIFSLEKIHKEDNSQDILMTYEN